MLVKIHNAYRTVVAVCDKELIGRVLVEEITSNNKRIMKRIDLTGTFYKGEEKTPEQIKKIIINAKKEDATFNIVGKKSCALGKEIGIIKEHGITTIQGIPVALVLL